METFTACDESEIATWVGNVWNSLQNHNRKILLLEGDMGAGKTTFVKKMVNYKLPNVLVDSPTFSIVNTYKSHDLIIHHFDLYRLESEDELLEIGFEEYLENGDLVLIEWPLLATNFLPKDACMSLKIFVDLQQCRGFSLSSF